MRVCDGSCRRLSRLCRQGREQVKLVEALATEAEACVQAGHTDWAALMQCAADALRHTAASCCGSDDTQAES
ncbi:MAG: hypothetical protein P8Z69_02990 [Acidihalobacter sp.]